MYQPTQPPQAKPEFQPQGQAQQEYYNPMNLGYVGGAPVAGGQGPIPAPEGAPQHIEITQPQSMSFIPDKETEGIINSTYPELNNAMINIAIKKFAVTAEFANFYTKLEYKAAAEPKEADQAPKQEQKQNHSAPATPSMDFSSW
jgi:hypothetical protein